MRDAAVVVFGYTYTSISATSVVFFNDFVGSKYDSFMVAKQEVHIFGPSL